MFVSSVCGGPLSRLTIGMLNHDLSPLLGASFQLNVVALSTPIKVYASIETLFLLYQCWLSRVIQTRNKLPVRDHDRTLELFNRALTFGLDVSQEGQPVPHTLTEDQESVQSFREAFAAWFFHIPFESLSREDVVNWLAWSLLDLDAHDLNAEQRKLVDDCCDLVERRGVWTFKRSGGIGNDPKAKKEPHVRCIRLTIDRQFFGTPFPKQPRLLMLTLCSLRLCPTYSCPSSDQTIGALPRRRGLELASALWPA